MVSVQRRRQGSVVPPVTRPARSESTAEFIIGQTADWIRAADSKASILLAGLTLVLTFVSSQARELRALWTHGANRPAFVWALAAAALVLVAAYILAVSVLVPRMKSVQSRYAWPWLATASDEDLRDLTSNNAPTEAWHQARVLAEIAQTKFHRFKMAVWVTAASVALLIACGVLRA